MAEVPAVPVPISTCVHHEGHAPTDFEQRLLLDMSKCLSLIHI